MGSRAIYPASIKPGIPRLGVQPPGWKRVRFGDILTIIERPVDVHPSQEYQLVTVKRSRGGIVTRERLLGQHIKTKHQYAVRKGDFLISNRQIIHGACGIVPPELDGAIVSGEYTVLLPKPGLSLDYLGWYSHTTHFQQTCFHSSFGVDVEKMVFNEQEWLHNELFLPTEPEQEEIARVLSTWKKGLGQGSALIAAKQQQRAGLMQQLLTGRRRVLSYVGVWETKHLGDLFIERNEANRPDLRLLSITASAGVVPRDELDKRDTSSEDKSKYKRIAPGDIGYNTMRMWQGVSALSGLEGIVSPAYTVCIPQAGIHGPYAKHLFKYPPMVHKFWRYSQGLVDDTLNLKFAHFSEIEVTLPSMEEQRKIAALLDTADREINLLEKDVILLRQQMEALMQKLLTGEIRVPLNQEV